MSIQHLTAPASRWIPSSFRILLGFALLPLLNPFSARATDSPDPRSGTYEHSPALSDPHTLGPEYPGYWIELEITDQQLQVKQALGATQNGYALPGSGETTATWTVPLGDTETDVVLGKLPRKTSAQVDPNSGALHIRHQVAPDNQPTIRIDELWQWNTDATQLVIERSIQMPGRQTTRKLVFKRVQQSP